MTFASALIIAAAFWNSHGYVIPCHPIEVDKTTAEMPTTPWGPAAMAQNGCDIWVSPRARSYAHMEFMSATYCAEVVHEVGHILGLQHTATGIMAPDGGDPNKYPPRCYRRG